MDQELELFIASFMGGGGPHVECGRCGREHVAVDSPYLSSHDLDVTNESMAAHYRERSLGENSRVVIHEGVDFVSYRMIDGMTIPDECECGGIARYKQFVDRSIDAIRSYASAKKLLLTEKANQYDFGD